jgi:hypothetical protein
MIKALTLWQMHNRKGNVIPVKVADKLIVPNVKGKVISCAVCALETGGLNVVPVTELEGTTLWENILHALNVTV